MQPRSCREFNSKAHTISDDAGQRASWGSLPDATSFEKGNTMIITKTIITLDSIRILNGNSRQRIEAVRRSLG